MSLRSHRVYGNYLNASKFIRVEVNSTVDAGAADPAYLPFGSFGPVRLKRWTYNSADGASVPASSWVTGGLGGIPHAASARFIDGGAGAESSVFTGSAFYPAIPLRASSSAGGLSNPKNAYFGIDTTQEW